MKAEIITGFKDLFAQVTAGDTVMQDALAVIKAAMPGFKDLFSPGTMSDKLSAVLRGIASFLIAFEALCLSKYGISEDDAEKMLAQYMDDKIAFPGMIGMVVEMIDGPLFLYLIRLEVKRIKARVAESEKDTVLESYTAAVAADAQGVAA
jgi:hypothetical protein